MFKKQILLLYTLHLGIHLWAADWPNWRGPTFDGISKESGWSLSNAEIKWRTKVGIGFSSMAVADERVYTMGHNGLKKDGRETVHCLDASTGAIIWTDNYPSSLLAHLHEGGPCATPTVHEARVYTISKNGRLKCYGAATGRVHWERDMMKAVACC